MEDNFLVAYSGKQKSVHLSAIQSLKDILKSRNAKFKLVDQLTQKDFDNVYMAIALGGDGTFLRTSHFVTEHGVVH